MTATRVWKISAIVGTAALIAAMAAAVFWTWKRPLPPSGGLYFFRRSEIAVPAFAQNDERWRGDTLGPTESTLGAEGCAVASAAMVLAGYGVDTDPKRLNEYLTGHDGYTERGWLYWEKAAEISAGHVQHVYEDLPSFYLIDSNLLTGNPVIARLRYPSGITHFVVIVGKFGFDYLIRDPGAGSVKGVYPLREFGSRIEALRFYDARNAKS
jgi:hypothetical protein